MEKVPSQVELAAAMNAAKEAMAKAQEMQREAEAAARMVEYEKRKAEAAAKALAEKEVFDRKAAPVAAAIVAELNKQMASFKQPDEEGENIVTLLPEGVAVKVRDSTASYSRFVVGEETRKSGRYSWRKTGRLGVVVSANYKNKRFPQKKDGSFSYEKIAAEMIESQRIAAMERVAARAAGRVKGKSADLVKQIAEKFPGLPISQWSGEATNYSVYVRANATKPDKVEVQVPKLLLNVGQAEKLLNLMVEFGIVKQG